MMRIIFERSGGIMGLKIGLTVDLDDLPASQAGTLRRLLDEADFFNLPENLAAQTKADEFLYVITVETESQRRTVRTSDTAAPDALRPLLNELSLLARSRRTQ